MITIFAVLFYAAPNVNLRGFKCVTPGSVFALVVWILASAAFAFYVANFGSCGTLGGVAVGADLLGPSPAGGLGGDHLAPL